MSMSVCSSVGISLPAAWQEQVLAQSMLDAKLEGITDSLDSREAQDSADTLDHENGGQWKEEGGEGSGEAYRHFLQQWFSELKKVDEFYSHKEAEQHSETLALKQQVLQVIEQNDKEKSASMHAKALGMLSSLENLENFVAVNQNGFFQVIKNHDSETRLYPRYNLHRKVLLANFNSSTLLGVALTEVYELLRQLNKLNPNIPNESLAPSKTALGRRFMITLSGPNKVGNVQSLSAVLDTHHCTILDLDQVVVGDHFSMAYVIYVPFQHSAQLLQAFLNEARRNRMEVDLVMLNRIQQIPIAPNRQRKFAINLINAEQISAQFMAQLSQLIVQHNISTHQMRRLSQSHFSAIELIILIPSNVDLGQFKKDLWKMSQATGTDISLQEENVFRHHKRLVVFDMDSTLIQQEVIDELARYAGVGDMVKEITHRAMCGELDFNQSLRARVKLLEGHDNNLIQKVIDNLIYTEGVPYLCAALKKLGYKLAVISGGFTPITEHVKKVLQLDYAFANTLEVNDHLITGQVKEPIVNAQRKADLLLEIAQKEGITPEQIIAIGDGANDLIMLSRAGLGVAFNAKPKVQEAAEHRINQRSMRTVLYLLGLTEEASSALVPDTKSS